MQTPTLVTEEEPSAEEPTAVVEEPPSSKRVRSRRKDQGPEILPSMEHFVALARKTGRPALLLALLERSGNRHLPELASLAEAKGTLDIDTRRSLFEQVVTLEAEHQAHIEHAAERIGLLNDHYGDLAVRALLDEQCAEDAAVLTAPTDRFSRALHLYLRQELPEPGAPADKRFERAEHLHFMGRKWRVQAYASHFTGPKGALPRPLADVEAVLRERIAGLFHRIDPQEVLIEQFTRRDLSHPHRRQGEASPARLHTLTATFNGTTVHYPQVANKEVIEHEEPAALSVFFSWEPTTGALAVFCEDVEVRRSLAAVFREVVLGCGDAIHTVPLREYDLMGFSSPEMLKRIERELVPGIEKITILQLRVAEHSQECASLEAEGREVHQNLTGFLWVGKDRRDARDIYAYARDVYHISDLTGHVLSAVKLVFRMARQPHRRTHNVSFQITMPNGLTDSRITDIDRRLIMAQLARLGVVSEF